MQTYQLSKAYELAVIFLRRLKRDLYCGVKEMQAEYADSDETNFSVSSSLSYQPLRPGVVWGRNWQTGWFRFCGKFSDMPEAGCEPVIRINTGSEALLYSPAGKALTGLTAFCWFENDFVREIYYPEENAAAPGEDFVLYAAVTANKLAGMKVDYDPPADLEHNGSFDAVFTAAAAPPT